MIIRVETNSRCGFHFWIPNLELSSRFLYSVDNCVGKTELIDVDTSKSIESTISPFLTVGLGECVGPPLFN